VRQDALDILQAHYDRSGIEMNEARRRMARIPDGARLIANPISAAPGFTLGNVHVMAGVPAIFEAMVASVLATLDGGTPLISETLKLEIPEGEIAGPLSEVAARFSTLSFGSYPFFSKGLPGSNVVVRGTDSAEIKTALAALQERLSKRK
jgi:molybdopterin-biosynthesis enzyme MoeA-like protein